MACGIALFCVVFLCDSPAYKTFVDSALQQEGTELTEFAAALFGGAAYAVVYSMGIAGFFLFTAIYLLAVLIVTVLTMRLADKLRRAFVPCVAVLTLAELAAAFSFIFLMRIFLGSDSAGIPSLILGLLFFAVATAHTALSILCAVRLRRMPLAPSGSTDAPEVPVSADTPENNHQGENV